MNEEKPKLIRRAQTISPFGVGSIYDLEGESFIAVDIRSWRGKGETIREPRLEKLLGVDEFKMAPAAPDYFWKIDSDTPGVPFLRFPLWMFCPECRRMKKVVRSAQTPVCQKCSEHPNLVPMRFVMACPAGHIGDVPWGFWAHTRGDHTCHNHQLQFLTMPGGGGLEFLKVKCETCNSERNLSDLVFHDSLVNYKISCSGKQPWQPEKEKTACKAIPQVLQRGAGNLTFASLSSSIDIPPHSTFNDHREIQLIVENHHMFSTIETFYKKNNPIYEALITGMIDNIQSNENVAISRDLVLKILRGEIDTFQTSNSEIISEDEDQLLKDEYEAITGPDISHDIRDNFIKRHVSFELSETVVAEESHTEKRLNSLKEKISHLVQIQKLREVRVLKGFSRLSPHQRSSHEENEEGAPGTFHDYDGGTISVQLVRSDLGMMHGKPLWLPAIEVFGEGIFFSLNEKRLQKWENQLGIMNRSTILSNRRNNHASYLPEVSPRLILLHTFSHIVIRQLSFECGYSIASLRERIYAEIPEDGRVPMAGILIYTAAGDAEGTLGGLVREGKADRIFRTILKAIQDSEWCSSDPLCKESRGQGLNNLNLAACHACTLLPETSCIMSNRLLDRCLLIGDDEGRVNGYFSELLD